MSHIFMVTSLNQWISSSDYTGFSDASRASIQMTHSAFGPTVSLEEAQRIERETAKHLLKSRKLSLIVDLDQTIVHATVDPTVGEWISDGEAWEARQAKKASTSKVHSDDSDDSASDSEGECNPNWEALKDVKKFRLGPESFGAPSLRGSQKGKGKNKLLENEGCMYYIKPRSVFTSPYLTLLLILRRPGWKDFLRTTATKYEMHVYTMGTRAYAEEVCDAIDPDGNIFGGRLLSRDESGSEFSLKFSYLDLTEFSTLRGLTQKSLQRLFPCDTSMVVIIDDRADVWEWSPNLIKVVPCSYFSLTSHCAILTQRFRRLFCRNWGYQLHIFAQSRTIDSLYLTAPVTW
jgi:RNA polymerase II subunit A-like phosphatase